MVLESWRKDPFELVSKKRFQNIACQLVDLPTVRKMDASVLKSNFGVISIIKPHFLSLVSHLCSVKNSILRAWGLGG